MHDNYHVLILFIFSNPHANESFKDICPPRWYIQRVIPIHSQIDFQYCTKNVTIVIDATQFLNILPMQSFNLTLPNSWSCYECKVLIDTGVGLFSDYNV